jgi:hypothetical protein
MASRQLSENEKMLQVPIRRDLHKKLKLRCLELDITMAEQVQQILEQYLRGNNGKKPQAAR